MRHLAWVAVALGCGMSIVGTPAWSGDVTPAAALQQQAQAGDAKSEWLLAQQLDQSKEPKDKAAAMDWYRKAAAQGDSAAQWRLGTAYVFGDPSSVPRDRETGLSWMRKSLADGNVEHMASFGILLVTAQSSAGQVDEGVTWLQRAAAKGSTKAMEMLGMCQLTGIGSLQKNQQAAEQWLLKAAQGGDVEAQADLGRLYILSNMLGHTDVPQGLHWLHAAAEQGNAEAAGTLGYLLISGDKQVPKNPTEGVQWANKAKAMNNGLGYYALGIAYQSGAGEPTDPAQAWYNLDVANRLDVKHELAHLSDHLSDVASQLSPDRIAQLRAKAEQVPVPAGAQN